MEQKLNNKNLFNTMSVRQCQEICQNLGFEYRIPKIVGGAKEHYHNLQNALYRKGLIRHRGFNQYLESIGFQGNFFEFMGHVVMFKSSDIKITKIENISIL